MGNIFKICGREWDIVMKEICDEIMLPPRPDPIPSRYYLDINESKKEPAIEVPQLVHVPLLEEKVKESKGEIHYDLLEDILNKYLGNNVAGIVLKYSNPYFDKWDESVNSINGVAYSRLYKNMNPFKEKMYLNKHAVINIFADINSDRGRDVGNIYQGFGDLYVENGRKWAINWGSYVKQFKNEARGLERRYGNVKIMTSHIKKQDQMSALGAMCEMFQNPANKWEEDLGNSITNSKTLFEAIEIYIKESENR